MMAKRISQHDESWLLLPWLANGRLSQRERLEVEEHLRECAACTEELARQRLMCRLLTEPERVTYAPGPSLRKLLDRIDGHASREPRVPPPAEPQSRLSPRAGASRAAAAAWRSLPLAWAASLVLAVGLAAVAYLWSQERYGTVTNPTPASHSVLHVAFERSLPIGEVEQMLRAAGARVVEGPDASGIFGIAPASAAAGSEPSSAGASPQMRALAARLRADQRVRWVEPIAAADPSGSAQGRRTGGS